MAQPSKSGGAATRLASLFDDGAYTEIDAENSSGALAAYGSIGGATAFAFCQNSAADGCAVDKAQARKFSKVYDLAAKTGSPIVVVYDSGGVRLEDGFAALKSSSKILRRVSELSGVVPQVAVVLGPCGGTLAMAAAMADFCVMSDKGELFLTPAFNDKADGGKTANVGLPEYAAKAGIAAAVCASETEALAKAAAIVGLMPLNNLTPPPVTDFAEPVFAEDACPLETVCDLDSAVLLFEGMGSKTCRTALATVGGMPVGVLGVKGNVGRDEAAKCARLVEVCDAFNLPVVSFIDVPGFTPSADNDLHGGIRAAARLAHVLAEATSPKVTVVTGSAIGAGYSVFCGKNAGSDMSCAWTDAVLSPLAPAACASLLWRERITKDSDIEALGAEYAATAASAQKAAEAGAIDTVLAPEATRAWLISALDMLSGKRVSRLPKKHGNMPL